ncbi:MAG: prolipoprotein diacylglyceryl transferase family protein, partial [Fimbriiglobus sp.]
MQQILFHIPFTDALVRPSGVPVFGFGVMLFLTFLLTAIVWGPRRAGQVGLSKDRLQDLAIVLFLTGIAGARLTYMIQYRDQFAGLGPLQLVGAFFSIWNGGIVLYGSIIGGFFGYLVFYRRVLQPLGISGWKMADVVAPLLALGIAVGRLGCYLNGCCWGQAVCEECQPVPLSAALGQFPLLPAHARDQVCRPAGERDRLPNVRGLQTSTGFTVRTGEPGTDPRVVAAVEPGSAAETAGLEPGDRIVTANGEPNRIMAVLSGPTADMREAVRRTAAAGGDVVGTTAGTGELETTRVAFNDLAQLDVAAASLLPLRRVHVSVHDRLWEQVRDWRDDRKGVNRLEITVNRDGSDIPLTFTPRTVPFYPTQLYEFVSMALLVLLLVAFQPFRRHDGQVMVVWMLGYAVHRFFNEAIRIEPTYAFGLTLSQWISVGIFAAGVLLEVCLRLAMPKLPPGPQ